jgi:protocatechuate 3,4-dioxygenase alpha subunit
VYLPENAEALAADPLLSSLDPERRQTLIARRDADGGLTWDIRLQGEGETVFLDFEGPEGSEGSAAAGAGGAAQ